jgi:acyl-CoA reductase-like NAD-dependent aldehyde dehydrogenase
MGVTIDTEFGNIVPLWINRTARPLDKSSLIDVVSSISNKVVYRAQRASTEDAQAAADAASSSFDTWRKTTHVFRRNLLLRVADIYERRADELTQYQMLETSCTEQYARFNIKLACNQIREFAAALSGALSGEIPPLESDGYGLVFNQPIGPVLIIPPWNNSIILSTRGVSAALAAGCTAVLKASELCPRTHHAVIEAFEEAGLPHGCLNQVQASRSEAAAVTETLTAHPTIRKIDFIGSAAVGRIIGQVAAKYFKPVPMELGGKSPAIVLKDADLASAARLCAFGAFLHHVQICFSTERIIVEESVAEEFSSLLATEVSTHYNDNVGHAMTKSIVNHAHSPLKEAQDRVATFLAGDNSFNDATGVSLQPTIISAIKDSDKIRDEETFGPSATLYTVRNIEEAIKLANLTAYRLNATVHTTDMFSALQMAENLEFGQVHVNAATVYDQDTLPVSGTNNSGWGSNNGKYGLAEFLVRKTVTLHQANAPLSFGS